MPNNPKDVFDEPENYWSFLTARSDEDFEGQFFDRKEAGRVDQSGSVSSSTLQSVRVNITECVSAFANANVEGGLLAIGISSAGEVLGICHLTEKQQNSLTNLAELLRNQSAQVKIHEHTDHRGNPTQVCLIYTPYCPNALVETVGKSPKAWARRGKQNLLLDQRQREQILRDKKIVAYERTHCCRYERNLIDRGVLEEFQRSNEGKVLGAEENFLYAIGAIERSEGQLWLTNAGMLFFGSNPQRVIPYAYIRLLRFNGLSAERDARGLPTFGREFSGCISKQIRELRTFLKGSGFFQTYSRRSPGGGFIEEPELPSVAVDEAFVNAVAHRDYGVALPTECELYNDAFVVTNPGPVMQRDHSVPEHFTLADTVLDSMPRNSLLIEWLKQMKDEHGTAFVFALSEGTKRMRDEMANLSLPPPDYTVTSAQTTVTLFSDAEKREARLRSESSRATTEFTNLYRLNFSRLDGTRLLDRDCRYERRELLSALEDSLSAKDWFIDRLRFGRLTAHHRGNHLPIDKEIAGIILFFPAYSLQFHYYFGRFYLSIDYTLEVRNVRTLAALLREVRADRFERLSAVAQQAGWQRGRLLSIGQESSRVFFSETQQEVLIENERIYPQLSTRFLQELLTQRGVTYDLAYAIKRHSLSLDPNAARIRAEKMTDAAELLRSTVFPIRLGTTEMALGAQPEPLLRDGRHNEGLYVASLEEPAVEFSGRHETTNIRDGITKFGSYDSAAKDIELVPICTAALREEMAALIQRLRAGKFKYRGGEQTFSTKFRYSSIVTVQSPERALEECRRLLDERPEWIGDATLPRLFLVHTPEVGYALDDETSPYYRTKRLLLENGIPCQMVDTPTLHNSDYKDLNLALNITSKCGVTPWVLPGAIPDADFFVGLSYTKSRRGDQERYLGYANVFNQYGRWMFYSGSGTAFKYEERTAEFGALAKRILERLELSETASVYFHYSSKFSHDDRNAILKAAQSVRPLGSYHFIWINTHHNIRLYDSRPGTDGSLARGSYVRTSDSQLFLSTTGYNPFRKSLGMAHMLEINANVYRSTRVPNAVSHTKGLAMQVLSLTKLNWASTDSLCGEPITTKYASDIAYLTAAFLRQDTEFRLHPVLEQTPWFI